MNTKVRLTRQFLDRVEATGLSDSAIAAAIGVSKQFYSQVKHGQEQPTIKFLAGAVLAGLGDTFGDIAEVDHAATKAA